MWERRKGRAKSNNWGHCIFRGHLDREDECVRLYVCVCLSVSWFDLQGACADIHPYIHRTGLWWIYFSLTFATKVCVCIREKCKQDPYVSQATPKRVAKEGEEKDDDVLKKNTRDTPAFPPFTGREASTVDLYKKNALRLGSYSLLVNRFLPFFFYTLLLSLSCLLKKFRCW